YRRYHYLKCWYVYFTRTALTKHWNWPLLHLSWLFRCALHYKCYRFANSKPPYRKCLKSLFSFLLYRSCDWLHLTDTDLGTIPMAGDNIILRYPSNPLFNCSFIYPKKKEDSLS